MKRVARNGREESAIATLVLPDRCRRQLIEHAAAAAPDECCGVLMGHHDSNDPDDANDQPRATHVDRVWRARNVDVRDRRRRYTIDPADLLAAHKTARADDQMVVGYYHSHPERAPTPSDTDLEHAHPGTSYVIVGTHQDALSIIRSWWCREGAFLEQPIVAPDEPPESNH